MSVSIRKMANAVDQKRSQPKKRAAETESLFPFDSFSEPLASLAHDTMAAAE